MGAFLTAAAFAGGAAFLAAVAGFLAGGISISFGNSRAAPCRCRADSDNAADMSFPRFGVTVFLTD
jgi:hypothetical protein